MVLPESLNCRGYANTILVNGRHKFRTVTEHNHKTKAFAFFLFLNIKHLVEAVNNIKRKSERTLSTPARIIQDETNNITDQSQPGLPSRHALRQIIKRVRAYMPPTTNYF